MNPLVSITTVTLNNSSLAKWCIESVLTYTDVPFDYTIVDNGSTDDLLKVLDQKDDLEREARANNPNFCGLNIIRNTTNKYICHATNQGFANRKGQYYAFIPGDTVMTENYMSKLLAGMDQFHLDGISPRWFEPKDLRKIGIESLDILDPFSSATQYGELFKRGDPSYLPHGEAEYHREECEQGWAVGITWMIKQRVWEIVGPWDERFRLTVMDNDAFWRVLIAGYRLGIVNDVWIFHAGPISRMNEQVNPNYHAIGDKEWKEIFVEKWGTTPDDTRFLYRLIEEGNIRKKTLDDGPSSGVTKEIKERFFPPILLGKP